MVGENVNSLQDNDELYHKIFSFNFSSTVKKKHSVIDFVVLLSIRLLCASIVATCIAAYFALCRAL